MVSDEKQRIQNCTAMQMTKSFLLKFSAYKVHISETDLPKVVPEMIFKNQTLTINKSKLLMEPCRKTGRHLHSHLGSIRVCCLTLVPPFVQPGWPHVHWQSRPEFNGCCPRCLCIHEAAAGAEPMLVNPSETQEMWRPLSNCNQIVLHDPSQPWL